MDWIDLENNKERIDERYYFSTLGKYLPELVSGDVKHLTSPNDPPDFLVKQSDLTLGIEITEWMSILPNQKNLQEQLRFLQMIVDTTQEQVEKHHPKKLMVEFHFEDDVTLKGNEIEKYSKSLSEYILKNIDGKELKVDEYLEIGMDYPRFIQKILVRELIPHETSDIWVKLRWTIQKIMRIEPPSELILSKIIERKELKLKNWKKCDSKILVIVVGGKKGSIYRDVSPELKIESIFDRVILFNMILQSTHELKK